MTSVFPDSAVNIMKQDPSLYGRAITKIISWDWELALKLDAKFQNKKHDVTEIMVLPLIKLIYGLLYPLYFLGNETIDTYIKRLYQEALKNQNVKTDMMQSKMQEASSAWLYIFSQIYKGLYPLLMRMCCTDTYPFPEIFTARS